MRYWWVNQNRTYRQEVGGGYLWSPQRKKNGHRNPYYEFMREVSVGDFIFSYANKVICAIGIAQSSAYAFQKPDEFGIAGDGWDDLGWRVDVRFIELNHKVSPAQHANSLTTLMQTRYAPLTQAGTGKELYLTFVPEDLAFALMHLIGPEAKDLHNMLEDSEAHLPDIALERDIWEKHQEKRILRDQSVDETIRIAIVQARKGQGQFRQAVLSIERRCRVTGVANPEHLVASHIKPWRICKTYEERLDGLNGLALTPSIDHLFDRGFISFENGGKLLISPVAHDGSLEKMGVETGRAVNLGRFNEDQKEYLQYHREQVFLQAQVGR